MSIIVTGMKMPTTCLECIIGNPKAKTCIIGKPKMNTKCRDDCPLVEIPSPHGRLIDADEFVKIWKGAMLSGDIKPIVDARPTVIKAEGGEE